jgi:ribosomal protein L37AE/L43A
VVEHIPIFPPTAARAPARRRRASFDAFTQVWSGVLEGGLHRVSLIAALVIPLGWVLMYPPYHGGKTATMPRAIGLDATRSVLRLAGGATAISTDFPHVAHQERLGGKESCVVCHHVSLPGDRSTACSRCHRHELAPTSMFRHHGHMAAVAASEHVGGMVPANRSCSYCHAPGEPNTAASAKACFECHQKDMWLLGKPDSSLNLAEATSFLDAMHGTCLECHRREEARGVKEGLAECGTCHRTLRPRGWKPPAPAKQYAVRPVTAAPRADAQASLSASERDGGATH